MKERQHSRHCTLRYGNDILKDLDLLELELEEITRPLAALPFYPLAEVIGDFQSFQVIENGVP